MLKKLKNILFIIIIIFFLSLLINNISEYIGNNENNIEEKIEEENTNKFEVNFYSCIDGDTARFLLDEEIVKVRFLGINTPETPESPKGEEAYWEEAKLFTEESLKKAKIIEIEYDEVAPKKDKYDRILAWIWVDGKLLQEELISNGLAKTYMLQDNYKYENILKNAENFAKNNKVGIWKK